MEKEFEWVSHPQIQAFNIILVRIFSRAPHAHKDMEIGLILDGEVTFVSAGQTYQLYTGDMYLLNPMELHELHAEKESALILAVQFSRQLITSCSLHDMNTYFMEHCVRPFFRQQELAYTLLKSFFIELAYDYFSRPDSYELKCMSHLHMILYSLNTYIPKKIYTDTEFNVLLQKQNRLNRITDFIEKNYRQKLLLREIAEQENLSLTYLSHLFQDELKISFQEYLNRKRFEYACCLLEHTDKKILTISIESGFSDVRYLNRLCQRYYGCPASELRRRRPAPSISSRLPTSNMQNLFTPDDSALLLHTLRERCRGELSGYSLQAFYQ